jgi:hypothetical protein
MPVATTILVIVSYPLLYILPLNLVRFQWGFHHGPAPMPPEVQERAEAADRTVLFLIYFTLLTVGSLLLHRSGISASCIGLTTDNWRLAILHGVLAGFVPLGVTALFLAPNSFSRILRTEPDARGPLASSCGLIALGSLAVEFWRALCISALIHLNFSTSVAVLIAVLAYQAPELTSSAAKAMGAALYGAIAGFVFVKSGSLFAPLVMSLITDGTRLYFTRFYHPKSVICPSCNAVFEPVVPLVCPKCAQQLQYEPPGPVFGIIWFSLCFYGAPIFTYWFGYRTFSSILLSIGGAALMYLFGFAIHRLIVPPKAELKLKYGDCGLHLTEKPPQRGGNGLAGDKKL